MTNSKRTGLLRLMLLCALASLLTVEAASQDAYTDGKAAQLNDAQMQKLKALRAPIAVPTYVPAGYRLKKAGGKAGRQGKFWTVDYDLTYENPKGDSFNLVSANEGLGDVPLEAVVTGTNPFFGRIEVGTQDVTDDGKVKPKAQYESGWVENKRAYVPAGALSRRQAYRVASTALSAKEVLKVMVSLRYLK